jgi:PAS domain S-box-containing protein
MNTLSQQEFVALFENAALGIITVNPLGCIVMINQHALNQFGYERSELIGRRIEVLIPQRLKEKHEGHRSGYQRNDAHQRPMGVGMDLSALRSDGVEFPVEVSLSTYKKDDGVYSIAFVSDITVRKASANALLRLNDELERKVEERTQSLREALDREKELGELKTRFVSMASHEFRTPLSTILSSAYLISKYETDEDIAKREKHIQRIVTSVNMLTDILNDFLSLGKIEEGRIQVRPEAIDLLPWMKESISELEQTLKLGQTITHTHKGSTGEAVIDPSLLKHIVQNLISNASKFSPPDTTIEVMTQLMDHRLILSVKDEGMGISAEDQKHLFERFFRGTNAVHIQGTGLGLHIISRYVELMRGKISIISALNEGSTFTITFSLPAL